MSIGFGMWRSLVILLSNFNKGSRSSRKSRTRRYTDKIFEEFCCKKEQKIGVVASGGSTKSFD